MKELRAFSAWLVLLPGLAAAAEPVDFARDVQPLLEKNCTACHGPEKQRSGLRLDTRAAALRGGDSGAVLTDSRPDAYERLVERLLASPHYGERWGRHWLDQARYADSNSYNADRARSIWKYRDWVIHALNEDRPFDQFVVEQLAGDLLP